MLNIVQKKGQTTQEKRNIMETEEDFHEDMVIISNSLSSSKKDSPESSSLSPSPPPLLGSRPRRIDSLGDINISLSNHKVIENNHKFAISSIQNSPRVMRAAVITYDRPYENRKSSEDLLAIRSSLGGAASRSLDPNTWAQVAIPIDLEPFLHPEKLFVYPVVDSPK